ncbi:MAG TPA: DUF222 domain-containing protein [Acidimicrobiales bacterium]|nr:DUF222 domain-containing protein [Acidimicrobiales bacterium]
MGEQVCDVVVVEGVVGDEVGRLPLERLEAEITSLAGQLAAAECRWLLLVAEMDRRRGWESWECRSCAQWLSWRCGLSLRAAHERVRVARALGGLPVVTEAFSSGQLSYSKVRAVTRFATEATESEVVEMATHATAAHLDTIAAAHARAGDVGAAERREAQRYVRWHTDDDGTFVLSARLPPEAGALVRQAVEAAVELLRADERRAEREAAAADGDDGPECPAGHSPDTDCPETALAVEGSECPAGHSPDVDDQGGSVVEGVVNPDDPVGARRADALGAIMAAALAGEPLERLVVHRHQVVVHADLGLDQGDGVGLSGHLQDGPGLSAETIRRLACDSTIVTMVTEDGEPVGTTQTSSVPAATRRAVVNRDHRRCRWPGCTSRHVDVHHITYQSNGGSHAVSNLLLLCRHHHRAVHEGGYRITGTATAAVFLRPDGTFVPSCHGGVTPGTGDLAEANQRLGIDIGPDTIETRWDGEPLDLHHTIWALLTHEPRAA